MTGDQSKMGIDLRNGAELAVTEWNEKGGVLGKKIELLAGDDQADPKQAVSIANKIVNQKVTAVVGHWNSNCSINASSYYNAAHIVAISPASTNPRLTQQGFKTIFRVCGTDDQQGGVAAEFVIKNLRPKGVAVLHDKTTYGQGLADFFKKTVEGKVQVVYYDGIQTKDPDYKAVLTAINEQKGVVYAWHRSAYTTSACCGAASTSFTMVGGASTFRARWCSTRSRRSSTRCCRSS